jgi:hypothetical protein
VIGSSAHRERRLEFTFPCCYLLGGRVAFASLAFIASSILTTPLLKLTRPHERVLLMLVASWFVGQVAVWPFLAPAFNRSQLAALQTTLDKDGVCRQSTDYTCGPAAAVTLLRRLGLPAEEGELSVLARTTRVLGTPPSTLQRTLADRYRADGLRCDYRPFDSIEALRCAGPTLAVIKFGLLTDHYVAVLDVTERTVVVGDPLEGKQTLAFSEFESKWRRVGIVLARPDRQVSSIPRDGRIEQ